MIFRSTICVRTGHCLRAQADGRLVVVKLGPWPALALWVRGLDALQLFKDCDGAMLVDLLHEMGLAAWVLVAGDGSCGTVGEQ